MTRDPQLGNWVHKQRIACKNNKLSKDRVALLKSIEFAWDGMVQREAKENNNWVDMYQRLVSYKEEHAGSI